MTKQNLIEIKIDNKLTCGFSKYAKTELDKALLYLNEKLNEIFTCKDEHITDLCKVSLVNQAGLSINREIFIECGGNDRSSEVYDDTR